MKTDLPSAPSVFAISVLLALVLAFTVLGQEPVILGRVFGVTDGDTLKVLVCEQKLLRIRLAFFDAPEKKQAFGVRAKQAMSELVFGKDIELRTHAKYLKALFLTVPNASDGKDRITGVVRNSCVSSAPIWT